MLPNPLPRGKSAVEIEEGTEMKTFNVTSFNQHARRAHDQQCDEAEDVVSDDDIDNVAVNERLYGTTSPSAFPDDEYEEEFSAKHVHRTMGDRSTLSSSRFGSGSSVELPVRDRDFFHSSSTVQSGYGRAVDSSVAFPLSAGRRSYGTISPRHESGYTVNNTSEGTYIHKDISPKSRLLAARGSPPPSCMPRGEPIQSLEEGGGAAMSSEDKDKNAEQGAARKKKKKKKHTGE